MRRKGLLFTLALMALAGGCAWLLQPRQMPAAPYYVSTTGNDLGSGSELAPWRTLQHAAGCVGPGDTVIVLPGEYAGFDLRTSGQEGSPITFRASGLVRITADNPVTPDGINLEGASYVTIEGFEVAGRTRAGIRSVVNSHVVIRGNRLDANGKWGILTGHSYDLLIECNQASGSVEQHGIYVSNSGDRPVIRGNIVWGNSMCGIHMNGDLSCGEDGIISEALVEQNVIFDNGLAGGSGINCDGVQDSIFRNNLLYGNHASGISLYQGNGAEGSTGNVVVNNTIVQAADGRWALNIQNAGTGNTVRNNILYNDHPWRGSIAISPDSLEGFLCDYNVLMERFTLDGGNSVLDLTRWRRWTGQDAHSLLATPGELFVDPAAGDYHLRPAAPAVDAGTPDGAPDCDYERQKRPYGGGPDIGADEYLLSGDTDLDLDVDFADYQALEAAFGLGLGAVWGDGDFDADGDVDFSDYQALEGHFGLAGWPAGPGVPEPAAAGLLMVAGVPALSRRGQRGRC